MKLITSTVFFVLVLAQPAFAERGQHDFSKHRGKHMDHIIEELNLSSEQEPAVRQILEEQHTKFRSEMEAMRQQMEPKMEALKTETGQRLSGILSAEQLQIFNTRMEERHNRVRQWKSRWQHKGGRDHGN